MSKKTPRSRTFIQSQGHNSQLFLVVLSSLWFRDYAVSVNRDKRPVPGQDDSRASGLLTPEARLSIYGSLTPFSGGAFPQAPPFFACKNGFFSSGEEAHSSSASAEIRAPFLHAFSCFSRSSWLNFISSSSISAR